MRQPKKEKTFIIIFMCKCISTTDLFLCQLAINIPFQREIEKRESERESGEWGRDGKKWQKEETGMQKLIMCEIKKARAREIEKERGGNFLDLRLFCETHR